MPEYARGKIRRSKKGENARMGRRANGGRRIRKKMSKTVEKVLSVGDRYALNKKTPAFLRRCSFF